MEIPITISIQGNTGELARDLFGLGEKVTDPEIIKYIGEGTRYVNKTATISDGITLGQPTSTKFTKSMESVQTGIPELDVAIFIADKILAISLHGYTIADWLWNKIKTKPFIIKLNGKEVTTKEDFQKTLDEYIQSHSSKAK